MKPWHGGAAARELRARVAHAAIGRGRRLAAAVARWARRGIAVPAADPRGRPRADVRVCAPVRVAVLAGDRDRWLGDLAGPVARHGIVVGECWSDGGVVVRHGHELDPACRRTTDGVDDRPTLAESVAVDLVARFAKSALDEPGISTGVRGLVRALAWSRTAEIPQRLAGWLEDVDRRRDAAAGIARLEGLWRRAVAAWLAAARRCVPSCEVEFDHLSALAAWYDGGFRSHGQVAIPAAIHRLGVVGEAGMAVGGMPTVLGHTEEHDGPSVRIRRGIGGWESVVPPRRMPPVVTIAAVHDRIAGGRIVDAA